jgi:hypothetical protein
MHHRRLNWKVAAAAGSITSVGLGGFALAAAGDSEPADEDQPGTTEVESADASTLSAPVLISAPLVGQSSEELHEDPDPPSDLEDPASVASTDSVASIASVASTPSVDSPESAASTPSVDSPESAASTPSVDSPESAASTPSVDSPESAASADSADSSD